MTKRDEVFVDTSGFKALVDPADEFHTKAMEVWGNMAKKETNLITSNFILDECYTLIRVRCGIEVVKDFRKLLAESGSKAKVVRVTLEDELTAWDWFEKKWSKLSFTDCVCFATMKRLGLSRFFGFDDHFRRAGFEAVA